MEESGSRDRWEIIFVTSTSALFGSWNNNFMLTGKQIFCVQVKFFLWSQEKKHWKHLLVHHSTSPPDPQQSTFSGSPEVSRLFLVVWRNSDPRVWKDRMKGSYAKDTFALNLSSFFPLFLPVKHTSDSHVSLTFDPLLDSYCWSVKINHYLIIQILKSLTVVVHCVSCGSFTIKAAVFHQLESFNVKQQQQEMLSEH